MALYNRLRNLRPSNNISMLLGVLLFTCASITLIGMQFLGPGAFKTVEAIFRLLLMISVLLVIFLGPGYYLFRKLRKLQSLDMLSTFDQYLLIFYSMIYGGIVTAVIQTALGDKAYIFWRILVIGLVLGVALRNPAKVLFAEDARGRRWRILRDELFFIPHIGRVILAFGLVLLALVVVEIVLPS